MDGSINGFIIGVLGSGRNRKMRPGWTKVFEGSLHVSVSLFLDCMGQTAFLCSPYSFVMIFLPGHRPSKESSGSHTEVMSPNNLSSSLSCVSQTFYHSDKEKKKSTQSSSSLLSCVCVPYSLPSPSFCYDFSNSQPSLITEITECISDERLHTCTSCGVTATAYKVSCKQAHTCVAWGRLTSRLMLPS